MSPLAIIVEDNPTSADIAVRQLQSIGFSTQLADTAQSGMDLIYATNPDLVVIDERLPDLSGIDVIRTLRKEFSNLTIVMSTIVDDTRTINNALAAGCNYYAIKPNGLLNLCRSLNSPELLLNTEAHKVFAK